MMWNLQSYTKVLNEKRDIWGETYSYPSYIFSGGQNPPNPQDLHPCCRRLAFQCSESIDRYAIASGDKLQQTSSSFVVKLRHCPPEPLYHRRVSAARLQSRVSSPVFHVDLAHAAYHNLLPHIHTHSPILPRLCKTSPQDFSCSLSR